MKQTVLRLLLAETLLVGITVGVTTIASAPAEPFGHTSAHRIRPMQIKSEVHRKRRSLPACRNATFSGDGAHLRNYLNCNDIPFTVVDSVGGMAPTAPSSARRLVPQLTGGPSCQWTQYHVQKVCFHGDPVTHKSVGVLICSKYYADGTTSWPYHCGPLDHYTTDNGWSLWHWISRNVGGALLPCLHAALPGAFGGIIVRLAGGGWIAFIAGAGGGCMGGAVNARWKYSTAPAPGNPVAVPGH